MPDWDADSPQLQANLTRILHAIASTVDLRTKPVVEWARRWHVDMMAGLAVPHARYVGAFRGEAGLENIQVRVLSAYGAPAHSVSNELASFETKLRALVMELDALLPVRPEPDADQLAALLDLCAWAHAEWIRIHPFANGNGRTARLWANSLAMRYGLPPFVRLRPRPESGYGEAGAKALQNNWQATAVVFRRLLNDLLDER